ncbi:MAG: HDOD domain-containing protein [Nitrospirota bacterium]|nr:HDOD domain-containing protein [Nitrospirota bacterium]MDH5587786.1 HDOD domain-containing protein [Nitrospirota bacterium]MDH5775678.1 HDOD domain-containing protein [Nitrospirota bacterium]
MTDTSTAMLKQSALVGRQAIFDRQMEIFGYELLYRDGTGNSANILDGDEATAKVMVNTFLELGIDQIAGNAQAFLNLTANFFLSRHYEVLPTKNVILEVLETIDPTPTVLEALIQARKSGYKIALDDFILRESHRVLMEHADLVKVDVLALTQEELKEQVAMFRDYPVRLLAEKVEDREMYEQCLALGFDYFQGYFFCKPQVLEGVRLSSNRMAVVLLLAKLQDPLIDLQDLNDLVKNDVALSVKLLRYVNSASVGLPRSVDSIFQAIGLVGTERMRQWASLLVLAQTGDKPTELMRLALIRAHMCESLCPLYGVAPGQGFTVGLFSVLDAYFDCEMKQLVADLPLASEILDALLKREGMLGTILEGVLAYEQGDWDHQAIKSVEADTVNSAYWSSVEWANGVMEAVIRK